LQKIKGSTDKGSPFSYAGAGNAKPCNPCPKNSVVRTPVSAGEFTIGRSGPRNPGFAAPTRVLRPFSWFGVARASWTVADKYCAMQLGQVHLEPCTLDLIPKLLYLIKVKAAIFFKVASRTHNEYDLGVVIIYGCFTPVRWLISQIRIYTKEATNGCNPS
jgi:hypothetical protein